MTDVIVVEEGEHSSFGPSSAERVINCPGSVNASAYVTDSATTYSALGTCKHHIAYLARLERCSPFKWLGRRIRSGEFEYTIDEEFCDEVEECVEYSEEAPGVPLLETRVAYTQYVPGGFGTLDDARIAETLCTITDYKFGKGHQVWAENNSQLKLYALGVWLEFGWMFPDLENFMLRICQPGLGHKDAWRISKADLLKWAEDTLPNAVREARLGERFSPGAWCTFCKIRRTCAHRAKAALGDVGFENLDEVEAKPLRPPALLTPDELSKLVGKIGFIQAWLKDVKIGVIAKLIAGEKVGDLKLVEGRSSRQWLKPEEEVASAVQAEGFSAYERKLLSVAKIEKSFGKKRFQSFMSPDSGWWRKAPGKPTLAPGSDKRPAMEREILNEFKDLDLEEDDE